MAKTFEELRAMDSPTLDSLVLQYKPELQAIQPWSSDSSDAMDLWRELLFAGHYMYWNLYDVGGISIFDHRTKVDGNFERAATIFYILYKQQQSK